MAVWRRDGLDLLLFGEGVSRNQIVAAAASASKAPSDDWARLFGSHPVQTSDTVSVGTSPHARIDTQPRFAGEPHDVDISVDVDTISPTEQTWSGVPPTGETRTATVTRVYDQVTIRTSIKRRPLARRRSHTHLCEQPGHVLLPDRHHHEPRRNGDTEAHCHRRPLRGPAPRAARLRRRAHRKCSPSPTPNSSTPTATSWMPTPPTEPLRLLAAKPHLCAVLNRTGCADRSLTIRSVERRHRTVVVPFRGAGAPLSSNFAQLSLISTCCTADRPSSVPVLDESQSRSTGSAPALAARAAGLVPAPNTPARGGPGLDGQPSPTASCAHPDGRIRGGRVHQRFNPTNADLSAHTRSIGLDRGEGVPAT